MHQGDCVEVMRSMSEASIDAIVCDPPYGLNFMGKDFDKLGKGAAQREWHKQWAVEALRVLKPGGHAACFGGTRTSHHLASATYLDIVRFRYRAEVLKELVELDRTFNVMADYIRVLKWSLPNQDAKER